MSTFIKVSDIEPCKEIFKINVQIIRLWKKYLTDAKSTIELVLCDPMGDKIHATVGEDFVARYDHSLNEGYWKIIENFSVVHSGGAFRTTQHAYKIVFTVNTRIRVCDFLPRPLTGFQPVSFRAIKDGWVITDYLVDVIGQIVGVSYLDIVSLNGKDTEKITMELRNQYDDRLTVHIWGKYAKIVSDTIHDPHMHNPAVCVLLFGKISVNRDRSVSNAYDVTDVSINPDMVEVEAFLKLLPKNEVDIAVMESKPFNLVSEIWDKYRYFRTTPMKSLIEVLETKQEERCIVRCTIAAIDYDMGWYYLSCKSCRHQLYKVPINTGLYGNHSFHLLRKYYCAKCKTYKPELLPRYNLQLVVIDNTSNTKFLMQDHVAEKLLQIPCDTLAGSTTDQIVDPVEIHKFLTQLVGETYFFKIAIESGNYDFNSENFKVVELIPDEYMINFVDDNDQSMGTPSANCSKFLAWIDCCHQYPEAEQLLYSEGKTRFMYDSKGKEWKKLSKRKYLSHSHIIKKVKTETDALLRE